MADAADRLAVVYGHSYLDRRSAVLFVQTVEEKRGGSAIGALLRALCATVLISAMLAIGALAAIKDPESFAAGFALGYVSTSVGLSVGRVR